MATPVSALDREQVRIQVTKDTTDRLKKEMTYQTHFSQEQIDSMQRSELIHHIITLRMLVGTITAVKSMVTNFVPEQYIGEITTPVQTPIVTPQARSTNGTNGSDTINVAINSNDATATTTTNCT